MLSDGILLLKKEAVLYSQGLECDRKNNNAIRFPQLT